MTCEGYDIRLTWSSTDGIAPATGEISKPKRMSRTAIQTKRNALKEVQAESPCLALPAATDVDPAQEWEAGIMRMLQEDHELLSPNSALPFSDAVTEATLWRNFETYGHFTLSGRQLDLDTTFATDILPICTKDHRPLRDACMAYQAMLQPEYRHCAAFYLQRALAAYMGEISDHEKLLQDATLVAGILLCSVSIASLYLWSPLLKGLIWLLNYRGLLISDSNTALTRHLIEVISLLDMPCWVINRVSPSAGLWQQHVAMFPRNGIEQTSGLPYSLIDIMCDLNSPEAEHRLQNWPGAICKDLMQVHYWEAVRTAAILHTRQLRPKQVNNLEVIPDSHVILAKLFAALQALNPAVPAQKQHPLSGAILYPLFIGSLVTEEGTIERAAAVSSFDKLQANEEIYKFRVAYDIIREVWSKRSDDLDTFVLQEAIGLAADLGIELYLY